MWTKTNNNSFSTILQHFYLETSYGFFRGWANEGGYWILEQHKSNDDFLNDKNPIEKWYGQTDSIDHSMTKIELLASYDYGKGGPG